MNSSAFLPLAFLVNPFASFTSAFGPNGISNPVSGPSTGGGSTCISGDVTLSINTPGMKLLYEAPQDQMAVTESFVELFQVNSTFGADVAAGGPSIISGDYKIFVKLCLPSDSETLGKVKTRSHSRPHLLGYCSRLQLHGCGLGSRLRHAFLRPAGGGKFRSSRSHPSRAGNRPGRRHTRAGGAAPGRRAGGGYRFDKVVGVGHSAGSTLTQGITTQYPKDFDAVILTGTSASADSVPLTMAAFNLINANTDPALRFQHLPAGFLTPQSAVGIQFAFHRQPNFDEDAFRHQVAHKQTNTLGVLLTLGGIVAPSTEFTGPVDIVNGENDLVFCGGNCLHPINQNSVALSIFYPAASKGSQTYIAAGAGHAIAAHKSGPDSFKHMIEFLQDNSL